MKKRKPVSPLARLIHTFARDENTTPEELEEVLEGVIEQEAEAEPAQEPEKKPAADNDLAATIAALTGKLDALTAKVEALTAPKQQDEQPPAPPTPAIPEADPLTEIAEAIEALAKEDAVDEDEDKSDPTEHLQDPQVISDEETEETDPAIAKDAMLGFLKAVKPVIAALPENQRRKATDAALAEFKKVGAKDSAASPAKPDNPYLALMRAKKQHTTDSAPADPAKVGRDIMAQRNPHYKK